MKTTDPKISHEISFEDFKSQILEDFRVSVISRECSMLGRREVLSGKAKFGIFGDGKELPQLAMARAFKDGDFRSGYYRDQTVMMALGHLNPKSFFHGLYATTDLSKEPMSAGRQMGGHFVTHSLHPDGSWKDLTAQTNSSADISCTAGQMPRLLGLAQASKIYRDLPEIDATNFSKQGNEIAWGTIGNASTSEGHFFETMNAAGVMQVPMVISIWDDGYGISVPQEFHMVKSDISKALEGFQRDGQHQGFEIIKVAGWDYTALIHAYENASEIARDTHTPVMVHVTELTQPQGHSTSGSHERYKSAERLEWERDNDCNKRFREWILANHIADEETLKNIEKSCKMEVRNAKKEAWAEFLTPNLAAKQQLVALLTDLTSATSNSAFVNKINNDLIAITEPIKKDLASFARKALRYVRDDQGPQKMALQAWISKYLEEMQPKYSSHLYSELEDKLTNISEILPNYDDEAKLVDGRIVLRDNFDQLFATYPKALVFGEDTGTIGDVNQGLEGLQKKYGAIRIADTGIRETSIIGQGIGMALRGLRPIAEIQYLDYIFYALQTLTDDLACLHYRTYGKQIAPLIIRTRGHRLEGIWHSGSPMASLIHSLRGIYILVPRNMTKAAGFYNTLMKGNEPALVIESLNGYRLKEKMPNNLGEFRTPIGQVEVVKEGADITLVSYGSTLRMVLKVAKELLEVNIDAEVIDIQTLLPFDLNHDVAKSVQKTNRLLVIDEDMPGGASAYLLQEIIEKQGAFRYLDSAPRTLTAQPHRPAYASDGDYFSKPNEEDIFEQAYNIMHEVAPEKYPTLR
ncbi:MAG: thiamine pyrophosphate-dependent enzyme [Bacteroidota bacterium]